MMPESYFAPWIPFDQPGPAGALAVVDGLRAAKAVGLRQPLQQHVEHQFPHVARRFLARVRATVAHRRRKQCEEEFGHQLLGGRVPLLVAEAQSPGGTLPIAEDGLTLSRPGVLVTALGADPAGNPGTLVACGSKPATAAR